MHWGALNPAQRSKINRHLGPTQPNQLQSARQTHKDLIAIPLQPGDWSSSQPWHAHAHAPRPTNSPSQSSTLLLNTFWRRPLHLRTHGSPACLPAFAITTAHHSPSQPITAHHSPSRKPIDNQTRPSDDRPRPALQGRRSRRWASPSPAAASSGHLPAAPRHQLVFAQVPKLLERQQQQRRGAAGGGAARKAAHVAKALRLGRV